MEIQTLDAEQSSACRTSFQGDEELKAWEQLSQATAVAVEAAFASHADSCQKIKAAKPMAAQMRKIFETLREYRKKDSTLTVAGCATWTEYCEKVLHRTDRAIRKLLEGENPEGEKYANKNPKPAKQDARAGLGSASHVNESHPQHQVMKDKGLIKDESEVKEAEEADASERPAEERITIRRKDGGIIPEATYDVDDAVRNSLIFIQSTYKFMNAQEKTEVIDKLIAKLQSERDFIVKETPVVIHEGEEAKPESPEPPKGGTEPHKPTVADTPATAAQPTQPAAPATPNRESDLAVLLDWASKYSGTAWHARKDCKGRLSSNKLDYITGLLNELADSGQIPFRDYKGRRMGQYSLLYSRPGRVHAYPKMPEQRPRQVREKKQK